ncbi:MAG TPA: hypothetical protein VFJ74_12015 [Gemmatimonadaceae bacterium]|nr:hypothetical protein [Gemmatimonadaceae bacterium]
MTFMLLIYNDTSMLGAMPPAEYNANMRDCFTHADELRASGRLIESQQLESPATAR